MTTSSKDREMEENYYQQKSERLTMDALEGICHVLTKKENKIEKLYESCRWVNIYSFFLWNSIEEGSFDAYLVKLE